MDGNKSDNELQELRASEQRFRAMAEAAPDILFMASTEGRCTYLNAKWQEYTGIAPAKSLGWRWTQQAHPDDREQTVASWTRAVHDNTAWECRLRFRCKSGAYRWFLCRAHLFATGAGESHAWLGACSDVDDLVRAQETLWQREQQFRTLADSIPQLAWMARPDGYIFWFNRRWYDYTGTTPEDVLGWGWQAVHEPAELPRVLKTIKQAFASGEPWEETFPLRRHDGVMRWHLSRMLPIKDEQGRVLRWFGTNTDITERLEMEQTLKEIDRRKDEFLAILAHELRNPLAPIRTGLELLRLRGDDPAAAAKTRTMMENQVRQMTRLVDDLLDVSRVSRGKLTLRKTRVALADLVERAVEAARMEIDAHGHELTVSLPQRPIILDADPDRLAQVFANLLNNAAKYTPMPGRIRLTTERVDGEVVVAISDTGIGIQADKLQAIFEMFMQIDQSLEQGRAGVGIGLTLVKSLVEMHGGAIEAHSAGRGQGSEFRVRLPLAGATTDQAPIPPADQVDTSEKRKYRVLIVDDNRDAADGTALLLQTLGSETRTAYTGAEAVEMGADFWPDLVLLDLGMPDCDGYETARRMRAQDWGGNAVIVALTGWGQEDDKQRARAAGCDHHLVKPADAAAFEKLLHDLARRT